MKITEREFRAWNHNVFAHNGAHRELRIGQSFCNHFNVTDSELYYMLDYNKAFELMVKRYVETDSPMD